MYPLRMILSPGWARSRDMDRLFHNPNPGGGNEDLVAFAAVHNLSVAGNQLHSRIGSSVLHGANHAAQIFGRQTFFEDEGGRKVERPSATHGQIVHGAVHSQAAD